jgi:hypothetical protein
VRILRTGLVLVARHWQGQYEGEGYGQRPYDNWETVMIDCNGRVSQPSQRTAFKYTTVVTKVPQSSMDGRVQQRLLASASG